MSFVVISSHEDAHGKDLQQPGDSVTVTSSQVEARERYATRLARLTDAARALGGDSEGGSTAWVALLQLPVPAADVDEALETLEIVIEETDDIAGELGDMILAYEGTVFANATESPFARERAIDNLHAWLV
jgi:hypothetical protein